MWVSVVFVVAAVAIAVALVAKRKGKDRLMITAALVSAVILVVSVIHLSNRTGEQEPRGPGAVPVPDRTYDLVDLPVMDRWLTPAFEHVFRVGDGSEEWHRLSSVTSLGFDADGNLYIADLAGSGGLQIIVVSPQGELVARFGRSGNGPGQFRTAVEIVALPDGRVIVPDQGHRAYHIFHPDGDLERMVRFPRTIEGEAAEAWGDEDRILKADREGRVFSRVAFRMTTELGTVSERMSVAMTEGPRQVERIWFDEDEARTEVIVQGWRPRQARSALEMGMVFENGSDDVSMYPEQVPVAFVPKFLFDVLPGGGLTFSDSSDYAIKITGPDGKIIRVLRRALPTRPGHGEHQERLP